MGRRGTWAGLMGTYKLSDERAHGAPLYVRSLPDGQDVAAAAAGDGGQCDVSHPVTHYLFRSSRNGKWVATDAECNIAEDMGVIASARAANLPCEKALRWQWGDASGGHDDEHMVCTEVVAGYGARSPGRGPGRVGYSSHTSRPLSHIIHSPMHSPFPTTLQN